MRSRNRPPVSLGNRERRESAPVAGAARRDVAPRMLGKPRDETLRRRECRGSRGPGDETLRRQGRWGVRGSRATKRCAGKNVGGSGGPSDEVRREWVLAPRCVLLGVFLGGGYPNPATHLTEPPKPPDVVAENVGEAARRNVAPARMSGKPRDETLRRQGRWGVRGAERRNVAPARTLGGRGSRATKRCAGKNVGGSGGPSDEVRREWVLAPRCVLLGVFLGGGHPKPATHLTEPPKPPDVFPRPAFPSPPPFQSLTTSISITYQLHPNHLPPPFQSLTTSIPITYHLHSNHLPPPSQSLTTSIPVTRHQIPCPVGRQQTTAYIFSCPGWVAEWTKAAVLKIAVRETVPWVRIPPHPFWRLAAADIRRISGTHFRRGAHPCVPSRLVLSPLARQR